MLKPRYQKTKEDLGYLSKLITNEFKDDTAHLKLVDMQLNEFINEPTNGPECNRHKLCLKHMR